MDKNERIKAAVQDAEAQLREIEALIERILRENKPEDAALVAAMMDDIKRRNVFN